MNKVLKFIAVIIMAGAFFSCSDMMETHEKYLEGGEKIYAPKVDSLVFYNGKGRVQLWYWLLEAPNVRSVDIFWSNYADSLIVPVTPSAGLDSMSVYIPLPDERAYVFYVRTTDIFGNHSLVQMGSATVYDSIYASVLENRGVRSASIKITDVDVKPEIQWYAAADDYVYSEVRYTDVNDEVKTVQVSANDRNTSITDAKGSSTYEYRTLYLPPNSIDTFFMEWVNLPEFEVIESTPFKGPHILSAATPCIIEARDFDFGGEGLAFHDSNSSNDAGGPYRGDNGDAAGAVVDVENGLNIGYTNPGEWQVYTVEVQDAGYYKADVYLSVGNGEGNDGLFSYSIDGEKIAPVRAPYNGSWSNWYWVFGTYPELVSQQPTFYLSQGKHKIRFTVENGGGFNVMSHRFINASAISVTDPDGKEQGEYLVGETLQLNVSGPGSISWSSDNTGVATVDASSGLVTVVGSGTATITATAGSYSDTYVLTSRLPLDLDNAAGYWQFENAADLTSATKGQQLITVGNGFTAIAKGVRVAKGSYYRVNHGIPASGGSKVNTYSLMVDFMIPATGVYYTIYQSDLGNSNDASCFIRPAGNVGLGSSGGYSDAAVTPEVWHRLVITLNQGEYNIYMDGTNIRSSGVGIDSKLSWSPDGLLLFGDNDGEDNDIDISTVAVWDKALKVSEIAALGAAE